METFLTYDDVLIKPSMCFLESRKDGVTTTDICGFEIDLPVIGANMKSVMNIDTLVKLQECGATGVLHRFDNNDKRYEDVLEAFERGICPIMTSIGIKDDLKFVDELISAGADILVVDTANAHAKHVMKYVKEVKDMLNIYPNVKLIVGNIATGEAAIDYLKLGVDGLKVGIGPGSACTTRIQTGCGVPQLSAIMEIYEVLRDTKVTIIADGGINYAGDIGKAIVAGANAVMIGKHIALTWDNTASDLEVITPLGKGKTKQYFGSASSNSKNNYIEGEIARFNTKDLPTLQELIDSYREALQSTISYSGGRTLLDIRGTQNFIRVSDNTLKENNTRLTK